MKFDKYKVNILEVRVSILAQYKCSSVSILAQVTGRYRLNAMNTMLNASTSTSGANATCDQKLWKWQELRAWGTKKARIASSVAKLNGKLKADIADAHAKISILTEVINQLSASKVGNLASTNCCQHEQIW